MQGIPYAEIGNKCPNFKARDDSASADYIIQEIEIWRYVCDCDVCEVTKEELEDIKTEWTIAMNAGAEPRKKARA
jgi:hypothetical protein